MPRLINLTRSIAHIAVFVQSPSCSHSFGHRCNPPLGCFGFCQAEPITRWSLRPAPPLEYGDSVPHRARAEAQQGGRRRLRCCSRVVA